MTPLTVLHQKELGWLVEMPKEMAQAVGVAEGSLLALYAKPGEVKTEVIPPLTSELEAISDEVYEENKEFFAELKRLGD